MISKIILANPIKNNGNSYYQNLENTFKSYSTEFGSIDPIYYRPYSINKKAQSSFSDIIHSTNNIRSTLTNKAIRSNKFNLYTNSFDFGYPQNNNYSLCNQRISSVFNYNGTNYTSFVQSPQEYPQNYILGKVVDLKALSNDCYNLCVIDHISEQCVTPPVCVDIPPDTISLPPNIKNTIKGYAFYTDSLRDVNVPNIGTRKTTCGGGHSCCRTDFIPKIITPNGMYSGTSFDMNNLNACPTGSTPVPGFTPDTPYERSAYFTITIPNINTVINTSLFLLTCDSNGGCHNGVTMIFLVAEDAVTSDSYLIFASCVGVGCADPLPIGTVTNPAGPESECVVPSPQPVAKCDEFSFSTFGCRIPTSGPHIGNPQSLALVQYINSILDSIQTLQINFDINGNFNDSLTGGTVLAGFGNVTYEITVVRDLSGNFTSMGVNFITEQFINGDYSAFNSSVSVSSPPLNPYNNVTGTSTTFGGWLAPSLGEECSLDLILN